MVLRSDCSCEMKTLKRFTQGCVGPHFQHFLSCMHLKRHLLSVVNCTLPERGACCSFPVHQHQECPSVSPHSIPEGVRVTVDHRGSPDQWMIDRVHSTHPATWGRGITSHFKFRWCVSCKPREELQGNLVPILI